MDVGNAPFLAPLSHFYKMYTGLASRGQVHPFCPKATEEMVLSLPLLFYSVFCFCEDLLVY